MDPPVPLSLKKLILKAYVTEYQMIQIKRKTLQMT